MYAACAVATGSNRPATINAKRIFFMLMSIEIMLNAGGLAFVVAGARWGRPDGQVMFLFIITVAAAEVSVGLALILRLYQQFKTVDVDAASELQG